MEILVIWIGFSALAGYVAGRKGRSAAGWFFFSLVLSPLFGLLGALVVSSKVPVAAQPVYVVSAPSPVITAPAPPSPATILASLVDMLDRGLITPTEFGAKKAELLARI